MERVLKVLNVKALRTEQQLTTWIFYDINFRWCADVSGWESLVEVCGGLQRDITLFIARVRLILSKCPCSKYFFGSNNDNDGRRAIPMNQVRARLLELSWEPSWLGRQDDEQPVARVLALVAFLDDWHESAKSIAKRVLKLSSATTELASIAQEIILDYCLAGFAWCSTDRRLNYYQPKFPYSDLVLFFQIALHEPDCSDRLKLGARKVEALVAQTFHGRGGRLPLFAYDMHADPVAFKGM